MDEKMLMSEFSASTKKTQFSSLLLYDLSMLFSFFLSNPLYFFYFIFFFPYLFKLLCFLSPLFFTTLLFLLVFVTVSPDLFHDRLSAEFSDSKVSFMLATFQAVVERLSSNHGNAEFDRFVEPELYKIVFDISDFDIGENPIQVLQSEGKENSLTSDDAQISKDLGNEGSDKGNLTCQINGEDYHLSRMNYQSPDSNLNTSNRTIESDSDSFRSTKKEKDIRRTLASRLFEERQNADGCEGMDMLWEKYETDSMKVHGKSKSKKGKRGKKVEYYDEEEDDEEDDEEMSNAQLCCLQALKFSAGKMSLGMGKSNIVKISKAFKGLRWVHHMSKSKGKKGHH